MMMPTSAFIVSHTASVASYARSQAGLSRAAPVSRRAVRAAPETARGRSSRRAGARAFGLRRTRRVTIRRRSRPGRQRCSSSSAGAPSTINRSRQASTRLKRSVSLGIDLAARGESGADRLEVDVAHELADVLALARAAAAAGDAARLADRLVQAFRAGPAPRVRASRSCDQLLAQVLRAWASRLRALLLGPSHCLVLLGSSSGSGSLKSLRTAGREMLAGCYNSCLPNAADQRICNRPSTPKDPAATGRRQLRAGRRPARREPRSARPMPV